MAARMGALSAASALFLSAATHEAWAARQVPDVAVDPARDRALFVFGFGALILLCVAAMIAAYVIERRRRRAGIYRKYDLPNERARRGRRHTLSRASAADDGGNRAV